MPWRTPPNQSAEYRKRADEAREKADATKDAETRKSLLLTADTWDRMAEYEDKHNPPRLVPGSK